MEEEEKISQTHQKLYVLKTVKMTHMKMTKTIDQIIKAKFWNHNPNSFTYTWQKNVVFSRNKGKSFHNSRQAKVFYSRSAFSD